MKQQVVLLYFSISQLPNLHFHCEEHQRHLPACNHYSTEKQLDPLHQQLSLGTITLTEWTGCTKGIRMHHTMRGQNWITLLDPNFKTPRMSTDSCRWTLTFQKSLTQREAAPASHKPPWYDDNCQNSPIQDGGSSHCQDGMHLLYFFFYFAKTGESKMALLLTGAISFRQV